jgi:hypothetical protein
MSEAVALRKQDQRPDYIKQVFFGKEDLRVGDQLAYWGVLDPGSRWRITQITSYRMKTTKSGKLRYDRQHPRVARFLRDDLHLVNIANGDTHTVTFAYVRYSAIWWAVPK